MPEVILETRDLNEALISAKTCVSPSLCDSLCCSNSGVQNAFALGPAAEAKGGSVQTLWEAVKCQLLGEVRPWSSEIYFAPLFQFQQMHISPLL